MCGVDVGFDNPIFAMIELEYKEADEDPSGEAARETEKKLTYYELDLGLNHVVRKWSEPISRTANILLPVPGGDDGPSGVLICGENWVSYKHQGHKEVRTALPRRHDMTPERGLLIVSATSHKQKDMFFFLLQSELGDIYKVTLVLDQADKSIVRDVVVTVFDTLPPAVSLCITKTGLLFCASEFGNHFLLQFQGIGDSPDAVVGHSVSDEINEELGDDSLSAASVALTFTPSSKLRNLAITDEIESLAPITDLIVDDISAEGSNQIYTLCGKGNRSSLRVLRHGVSVTEMAVSDLPGKPNAVWTVRDDQGSAYDKYIVVSFSGVTLVLSIGDNVEEVTDSGFLSSVPTLDVALLADNALLQVHSTGIRHIRRGEGGEKRISEWKTPGKKQIEKASTNSRQVAISLAGGEVTYFEIDAAGMLVEMKTLDMGQEVSCLDVGEVPPGRSRSSFLAVGCWDDTVQILSLEPTDLLMPRSTMSLPARPESVCLVHMENETTIINSKNSSSTTTTQSVIYLNIGLVNGVLHRVAVDSTAGSLSDSRMRFLGPKPVKLFRVMVRGSRGVLALATRAWLLYNYQGRYFQAPISYDMLDYASNFASEVCPEGIVAIAGNTLRVVTVDNLGALFNQTSHSLRYTPRKMCRIPLTNNLIVIETDHNEFNEEERNILASERKALTQITENDSNGMDIAENYKTTNGDSDAQEEDDGSNSIPLRGPLPPVEGKWASCIRVIDPLSGNALELLELTDNEAAFSLCTCQFSDRAEETFIVVGTAKDLTLHPRRVTAGFLHVYRLLDNRLQLLHKTPIEDVPTALCEFNGRLLVGMGKSLRLYELGKKKLLKKSENKLFPSVIAKIQVNGDRIYVGDMTESVHYVKYRRQENTLVIFADDYSPR
jgi:splicing factor 3B subunit 3